MGDDSYHNGAFFLAANFGFYANFGKGKIEPALPDTTIPRFDYKNPNGYDFFLSAGPLANFNEKYLKNQSPYWSEQIAHTNYDQFWQSRNISQRVTNIKPAVLTVGGWFDAEDLSGPLKVFRAIEKNRPGANHTLVMGPWYQGSWSRTAGDALGSVSFNAKTALFRILRLLSERQERSQTAQGVCIRKRDQSMAQV